MRTAVCALLASSVAFADPEIRVRRLEQPPLEPLLHLDATTLDPLKADGGIHDSRITLFDLGPRMHLATEGDWWQSGLSPSMFANDLRTHGWRATGELSYDLGPFRVGVNASLDRTGNSTHRMIGLFAYKTFLLSRWMHAWISLGISFEQWDDPEVPRDRRQGVTAGFTLGTTFR